MAQKISLTDPNLKVPADFNILYSGGLDSTCVALIMGKKFTGRIHLSTMDHNFGHLFVHWSEKHVHDIRRIHGQDRVIHNIFNTTEVFRHLTLNKIWQDGKNYGHFIWCLGCTLSMVTNALVHNLKNKIPYLFICSSVGGQYAVMSMVVTIQTINTFCRELGVDYRAPLLELNMIKPEERELLKKNNIWTGYRFRRGVHGVQPYCIPGFQHSLDVLFDIHSRYDEDKVRNYIQSRQQIMRDQIQEMLARQGLDMEKCITELKEFRDELEANHPA